MVGHSGQLATRTPSAKSSTPELLGNAEFPKNPLIVAAKIVAGGVNENVPTRTGAFGNGPTLSEMPENSGNVTVIEAACTVCT
jgi:hypothetical protein